VSKATIGVSFYMLKVSRVLNPVRPDTRFVGFYRFAALGA
jgi:hypothetical protein